MSAQAPSPHEAQHGHAQAGRPTMALLLATLGVVYGDIGTSPLYALKECFSPESPHHVSPAPENVLGVLSLVFWSLTIVVSIKYLIFILRADNDGSGGILALLALVPPKRAEAHGGLIILLVLFGAALLYGDGVITPAISVLSAIEGLEVATHTLKPAVIPLTVAILLALFLVQRRGTAGVGRLFGPMTAVWFVTIAALGARPLVGNPRVLLALDPRHAVTFLGDNGSHGFLVLGSVVLAITGAEALYADLGHFGRSPIRRTWFAFVGPALLVNYFGQGAYLLEHPEAAGNPFYALVPAWALYPVVGIATAATVVASQALISGAFSLTQQAVQLGYAPRVTVVHTSKEAEGQIYIPEVNTALLVGCVALVLGFKSSTNLAAAYGIAVTGTMAITTITYYVVVRHAWGWSAWKAAPLAGAFLVFDLAFFGANTVKILDGGWFPILFGLGAYTVMTTWKTGRRELGNIVKQSLLPFTMFLEDVAQSKPLRVPGTAVFMASSLDGTPPALLHHFKHNKALHEQVILLSVVNERIPEVRGERRLELKELGHGFYRVVVRYGFMEQPNVPRALALCAEHGLTVDLGKTSYYLGRETLLPSGRSKMMRWRKNLFAFISRNARPATAYFDIPANRVVELGMQIDF